MGRILFCALLCVLAAGVLGRLWPALGRGWPRRVWWALSATAVLGWLLPVLLGRSLVDSATAIETVGRIYGLLVFVFALGVVTAGTPFLAVRWLVERLQRSDEPDAGRRRFLRTAGRGVPLAAAAASTGGLAGGLSGVTVRKEEVRLPGLPEALDGFRIGQLTDVHVGAFIDVEYLREAVARLDAEKVDLQVMTGDLIDDLEQLEGTMQALDAVRARHGMLAILGNHEHWRGPNTIRRAYARCSNVRLLVDESVTVEHEGARLRVVGVDYPMRSFGSRGEVMARQAEQGFAQCESGDTVLCLSHHPDFFPVAAKHGAHLTLSGHTHGGQIAFFGMPLFRFAFEHMLGRYRREDRHLYVSGGTGHWLPMRIGVPAEVTVLTLRRA